jgi:Tfp pilus assembly protein FimT
VLAIGSILTGLTISGFTSVADYTQLKSGHDTLVQNLDYARQLARVRGTIVTVEIEGNELRMRTADDPGFVRDSEFPRRVVLSSINTLRFQPVGTVASDDSVIRLETASGKAREIEVSPLGVISSNEVD